MGVCCSKKGVVVVKETVGASSDKALLITENVGKTGGDNCDEKQHELDSSNPRIAASSTHELGTQEAEIINTYNQDNSSATRSTLIFPTYSGYQSNAVESSRFDRNNSNEANRSTPTAYVSPIQASRSMSPAVSLGYMSTPPPTRYSALVTPTMTRRNVPSPFELRRAVAANGPSGDFDSDLESSSGESRPGSRQAGTNTPLTILPVSDNVRVQVPPSEEQSKANKNSISTNTDLPESKSVKTATNGSNSRSPTLRKKQNTLKKKTGSSNVATNASIGIGTDKSRLVGTDAKTNGDRSGASIGVGTGASIGVGTDASIGVGTDASIGVGTDASIGVGTDASIGVGTDASIGVGTDASIGVGTDASIGVGTDASIGVGTDASIGIGTDTIGVGTATSTGVGTNTSVGAGSGTNVGVGTDPKHDMAVGTDMDAQLAESSMPGKKKRKKDNVIEMVDVCIGTDSDQIHRSTRSVQVNPNERKKRKKKMATSSTGTSADLISIPIQTELMEKKRTLPKIVTEDADDEKKKRKNKPPAPMTTSNGIQTIEEKPKPDPIIETLENAFYRFARYGEVNADGKEMNNKNWAKLCRDCEFVDHRRVLTGDVDVIFSRHKPKGERLVDFNMFLNCLNEIADRKFSKKIKDDRTRRELIYNSVIGKAPELVGVTSVSKTGNVDRMTDHHLYPVSHKMRFDEDGRGLGIDDKFEIIDQQYGYVHGYKERDQYDQKMTASKRPGSSMNVASRPRSSSSHIRPGSSSSYIRPGSSSSHIRPGSSSPRTRPSSNASARNLSPR